MSPQMANMQHPGLFALPKIVLPTKWVHSIINVDENSSQSSRQSLASTSLPPRPEFRGSYHHHLIPTANKASTTLCAPQSTWCAFSLLRKIPSTELQEPNPYITNPELLLFITEMMSITLTARSQTIKRKQCPSPYISPKNQNPKTSFLELPNRFAIVPCTLIRSNPRTLDYKGGRASAKQDIQGTRSSL